MFNNRETEQYDHIVPAYCEHRLVTLMRHLHELVALVETLLVKAARVLFVTVKAYRLQVFRHHDVYLTGPGLTVHLLADDGQYVKIGRLRK